MTAALAQYERTKWACYTGFVVQAIINNLAPLLFIVFNTQLQIPIAKLGLLITINFGVQLVTDLAVMRFADRIGYRPAMVTANFLAALGLVLLGVLPHVMSDTFLALAIGIATYAVGGGLLEVLVSPIIEHLPTPAHKKATGMALLHSFYCWGQLGVVIITTFTLAAVGFAHWTWLPLLWALVPLGNMWAFLKVPLPQTIPEERRTPIRRLMSAPFFLGALVLMMTGGAAELTMAQWSSFFAEAGMGVPKELGDLLGPGMFALFMGTGRSLYAIFGTRFDLPRTLTFSALGAAACYVLTAVAANPLWSLLGCALTGLMISLLWPGTYSLTAAKFPLGGAAMFAILAVAGDLGAATGPGGAGALASIAHSNFAPIANWLPPDGGSGLRTALLLFAIVPLVYAAAVWAMNKKGELVNAKPGS